MANEEYLNFIKSQNSKEFSDYKIKIIKEDKKILTNILVIDFLYEVFLNNNNIFIFNTILFKNGINNIKLDFWINKKNYNDENRDYIKSIYDSIDILGSSLNNKTNITQDLTNDINKNVK